MAHSILGTDRRSVTLYDAQIVALFCLLLEETESHPSRYDTLNIIVAEWRGNIERSGPGTIDLQFGRFLGDAEAHAQLNHALDALERRITDLGEFIPKDIINSRCPMPGIVFEDYPSYLAMDAIRAFRSLAD